MNAKTLLLLLPLVFSICFLSCKNQKKETVVIDTWPDGKPKKTAEYIVDDEGNKNLYKETLYFKNNQKFIEGTYNEKNEQNGIWISWFENGKKNSQGMYVNGKVDGKYTVWYPNGNVHYVGYYKNGQKTGKWKFYNESGKLTKENNY
ncbi:MAG: hypothetical protein KBA86_02380 [Bacteroidales bacterium]|nr:hypothetical protein [Bacteroidales bacterium]